MQRRFARFLLPAERLDAAIARAPLLLLGGLGLALASPAWGGVGCVSAATLAWIGGQQLLLLDWQGSIGARVRAGLFLLIVAALGVLVVARIGQERRLLPLLDLAAAGVVMLAQARFLASVIRGDVCATRREELPLDLTCPHPPRHPGHQGIQIRQDGFSSPRP